jgi:selenide,water dikinase
VGPGTLTAILETLPKFEDPRLLIGGSTMDDAGVYQLTPEIALVQTVDFFTPMVDDPYVFGQIAAANSLSDVYAMGAKPLTAMNVTTFPTNCMDLSILREILAGGADKLIEAETLLVGGHTVEDDVPKFGLAVTGIVHPQKVWANQGAKPGDVLVLTKPIGVGIISTAIKGELASSEEEKAAVKNMTTLNKVASDVAQAFHVHACTDVTGFGLLGHAYEMVAGSQVSFVINLEQVPVLTGVKEYAAMGIVPAGARRNLDHVEDKIIWDPKVKPEDKDILCDPQTSGGLLLALSEKDALLYLDKLEESGGEGFIIGYTSQDNPGKIMVKGE